MTPADAMVAAPAGLEERLREALAGARAGSPIAICTERIEPLDPIAVYGAAVDLGLEAALWLRPSEGQALVGIGRAWSIETAGPERFGRADAAWADLAATLVADGVPGLAGPILMGGLGFDGQAGAADDVWVDFAGASLVLPQLSLATEHGTSSLTAALRAGDGAGGTLSLGRLWEQLSERAATPSAGERPAMDHATPLKITAERPGRSEWRRLVGVLAGAVGRGRLDKVVLARRVDLAAATPIDVPAALRALAESAPEGAIFAFGRGGGTFIGATPERLVRTQGRAFQTMAVAGSARRAADPAEDAVLARALLDSEKDLEEHAVVVDALRRRLSSIAEQLSIAPTPVIMPLRHVQHLVTEIEGSLRERATPLALAERLHPTPAVAGEPTDLALALIAELEGFERGWYAGPVGWLSADGEGELMVALRCAVIRGSNATLFAGCGIVADSNPDTEWEESRIKLRTIAAALGVPGGQL